ncbi:MAG: SrfA family protein [Methylococcus sp.]|nr:SrfA family protein [Methylococcus sp.]
MAGVLLRSGSLKQFLPLGATGNPVYGAASQLRAAMRRQLGQEVADYFAVPVQDEKGQTIDWYSAFDGDVVPWTSATPEERIPARARLLAARERLLEKSRALQASEDSEQQVFGKLLALATRIPSEDHVYLVGGRPVMSFWGFSERDAQGERDVLGSLDAGAISGSAGARAAGEAAGGPPPVFVARRRWLWWLLPLLLLLGLLLFGLKTCGPELGLLGTEEESASPTPTPTAEPSDNARSSKDEAGEPPAPEANDEPAQIDSEDSAVAERGIWVDRYDHDGRHVDRTVDSSATVVESGREDQSPGGETDVESRDSNSSVSTDLAASRNAQGVLESEPPQAETGPGTGSGESMEPSGEVPTPDGSKASDPAVGGKPQDESGQPAGDTSQSKSDPAAEAQARQKSADAATAKDGSGVPLTIPLNAAKQGSTEFMNGQWRSVTGLQDTSGNPVQLEYDFKGKEGMARLKRSVGGKEMECTAPVTSSFSGSKLVIDQAGDIRCPDGSSIQRSKVECATDPQGHAVCKGKNPDGSDYNVRITKK